MARTYDRRSFMKKSVAAGAAYIAAGALSQPLLRAMPKSILTPSGPEVVCVTGENYYEGTRRAVHHLGGMREFVSNGSVVGLLVNSRFRHPGTYAKPQIALAVIAMCHEAGAKRVISLEDAPGRYWKAATLSKELSEYVDAIESPGGYATRAIPDGVRLKEAEFLRDLFECDVLINIGIAKDHEGTRFTGQLKNIMGSTSGSSNEYFHKGSNARGYYDDVEFLSGCIADANRIRKPSLSLNDVSDVILTNGPFGPGKIGSYRTIVAGTDPVAVDAVSATVIGLDPKNIAMISFASEYGIGVGDLSRIQTTTVKI